MGKKNKEFEFIDHIKISVMGDSGVGKRSITSQFTYRLFHFPKKIGVDFYRKDLTIKSDQNFIQTRLQIWTISGDKKFAFLRKTYFAGSSGVLLVFDLTSFDSFERLPIWIDEISSYFKGYLPILLVGNKSDLRKERQVSKEFIRNLVDKEHLYYVEASVLTKEGIKECFHLITCLTLGYDLPSYLSSNKYIIAPSSISAPKLQFESYTELKNENLKDYLTIMKSVYNDLKDY